eukprot:tig00021043_g17614.t1
MHEAPRGLLRRGAQRARGGRGRGCTARSAAVEGVGGAPASSRRLLGSPRRRRAASCVGARAGSGGRGRGCTGSLGGGGGRRRRPASSRRLLGSPRRRRAASCVGARGGLGGRGRGCTGSLGGGGGRRRRPGVVPRLLGSPRRRRAASCGGARGGLGGARAGLHGLARRRWRASAAPRRRPVASSAPRGGAARLLRRGARRARGGAGGAARARSAAVEGVGGAPASSRRLLGPRGGAARPPAAGRAAGSGGARARLHGLARRRWRASAAPRLRPLASSAPPAAPRGLLRRGARRARGGAGGAARARSAAVEGVGGAPASSRRLLGSPRRRRAASCVGARGGLGGARAGLHGLARRRWRASAAPGVVPSPPRLPAAAPRGLLRRGARRARGGAGGAARARSAAVEGVGGAPASSRRLLGSPRRRRAASCVGARGGLGGARAGLHGLARRRWRASAAPRRRPLASSAPAAAPRGLLRRGARRARGGAGGAARARSAAVEGVGGAPASSRRLLGSPRRRRAASCVGARGGLGGARAGLHGLARRRWRASAAPRRRPVASSAPAAAPRGLLRRGARRARGGAGEAARARSAAVEGVGGAPASSPRLLGSPGGAARPPAAGRAAGSRGRGRGCTGSLGGGGGRWRRPGFVPSPPRLPAAAPRGLLRRGARRAREGAGGAARARSAAVEGVGGAPASSLASSAPAAAPRGLLRRGARRARGGAGGAARARSAAVEGVGGAPASSRRLLGPRGGAARPPATGRAAGSGGRGRGCTGSLGGGGGRRRRPGVAGLHGLARRRWRASAAPRRRPLASSTPAAAPRGLLRRGARRARGGAGGAARARSAAVEGVGGAPASSRRLLGSPRRRRAASCVGARAGLGGARAGLHGLARRRWRASAAPRRRPVASSAPRGGAARPPASGHAAGSGGRGRGCTGSLGGGGGRRRRPGVVPSTPRLPAAAPRGLLRRGARRARGGRGRGCTGSLGGGGGRWRRPGVVPRLLGSRGGAARPPAAGRAAGSGRARAGLHGLARRRWRALAAPRRRPVASSAPRGGAAWPPASGRAAGSGGARAGLHGLARRRWRALAAHGAGKDAPPAPAMAALSAVTDTHELCLFEGPYGPARLAVLRTDAGPGVCVAELARLVGFAGDNARFAAEYGVPVRPLADWNAVLLLECLGAVARGFCNAQERPPHVLALRYVEEVVSGAWERSDDARMHRAAASLFAGLERRRQARLERLEMGVLWAAGARFLAVRARRVETPELQWWVPLASVAQAVYGDSRSTNCVRMEIMRRCPDLAVGGPHRFEASTRTVGRERLALLTRTLVYYGGLGADIAANGSARRWAFLSTLGVERLLAGLPDRDGARAAAEFKRARLLFEGADPASLEGAPSLPLAPPRRICLFGRKSWLTDTEIANVMTLQLLRAGAGRRVVALYPMHVEIFGSVLRRYARLDEAKRERRPLGAAERGACVLCPLSLGNLRRGAERTPGWSAGGHWCLLAVDGASKLVRCETRGRLQVGDGYQCGPWTLWFAEALTMEVLTSFPWSDEIDSGSLAYVRAGEPVSAAIAAENGRFITEKREAYRSLLEGGVVDQAVALFDEDSLPDAERVVLPPTGERAARKGSKPAAAAAAAAAAAGPPPSPSSSSATSPLDMGLLTRADFVKIYLRFLRYLREERRLAPGTLAGYTQSVMQACAFLEREKKQRRGWKGRGPNWISLETVLKARSDALAAHEAAPLPIDKAKALREAILIGFLSITPARVGVVRRLRIGQTLRRDGGAWAISLTEMRHETGELVSKTAKSHGAIVLPVAGPLQGPLEAYVSKYRRLLLPEGGADEGWLFASSSGGCLSESGWAVFCRKVMVNCSRRRIGERGGAPGGVKPLAGAGAGLAAIACLRGGPVPKHIFTATRIHRIGFAELIGDALKSFPIIARGVFADDRSPPLFEVTNARLLGPVGDARRAKVLSVAANRRDLRLYVLYTDGWLEAYDAALLRRVWGVQAFALKGQQLPRHRVVEADEATGLIIVNTCFMDEHIRFYEPVAGRMAYRIEPKLTLPAPPSATTTPPSTGRARPTEAKANRYASAIQRIGGGGAAGADEGPDGGLVDSTVRVWDVEGELRKPLAVGEQRTTPRCKAARVLQGHTRAVTGVAYLPRSALVVSASLDRSIRFWDPMARPHALTIPEAPPHVRVWPGYYEPLKMEWTNSNQPFSECLKLTTAHVAHRLEAVACPLTASGEDPSAVFEVLLASTRDPVLGAKKSAVCAWIVSGNEVTVEAHRFDDPAKQEVLDECEEFALRDWHRLLVRYSGVATRALQDAGEADLRREARRQLLDSAFRSAWLDRGGPHAALRPDALQRIFSLAQEKAAGLYRRSAQPHLSADEAYRLLVDHGHFTGRNLATPSAFCRFLHPLLAPESRTAAAAAAEIAAKQGRPSAGAPRSFKTSLIPASSEVAGATKTSLEAAVHSLGMPQPLGAMGELLTGAAPAGDDGLGPGEREQARVLRAVFEGRMLDRPGRSGACGSAAPGPRRRPSPSSLARPAGGGPPLPRQTGAAASTDWGWGLAPRGYPDPHLLVHPRPWRRVGRVLPAVDEARRGWLPPEMDDAAAYMLDWLLTRALYDDFCDGLQDMSSPFAPFMEPIVHIVRPPPPSQKNLLG